MNCVEITRWIEINEDPRRTYNTINLIKYKTAMLKPSLCDYSDAHILVKGTTKIARESVSVAARLASKKIKK